MLKVVYSFFLGLLLVVFVGMGVASFYRAPKAPEYPAILQETKQDYTDEQRAADQKYESDYKSYSDGLNTYSRNVAIIALVAAVVLVVLGLVLHARSDVIADGLLLGGVFTLLYSIARSFAGGDPRYSFMVTAAGLIVTMVVGYIKFVKPQAQAKKAQR